MRLVRLAVQRLAASVPGLVIILIGVCLVLELAPGDSVDALMSQMGSGDDALATTLREYYGLDRTVTVRLLTYLWRLVHLDFGISVQFGSPVASLIFARMPVTLALMASALIIAFVLGSVIGVVAARRVNGWQDTLICGGAKSAVEQTLGQTRGGRPRVPSGTMTLSWCHPSTSWPDKTGEIADI